MLKDSKLQDERSDILKFLRSLAITKVLYNVKRNISQASTDPQVHTTTSAAFRSNLCFRLRRVCESASAAKRS